DDWVHGQTLEQVGFKQARIDAFHRLNHRRGSASPTVRCKVPLSVKTRVGYDEVAVEAWLEDLLKEQPTVISLHGRTLTQMYRGAADWSAISRAARWRRDQERYCWGTAIFNVQETSCRAFVRQVWMAC
ncbi:MAG: hypothetical protein HC938_08195, partial [Nitrospira sp.]|nr:hypothetical protein [Nitrospira sp.]